MQKQMPSLEFIYLSLFNVLVQYALRHSLHPRLYCVHYCMTVLISFDFTAQFVMMYNKTKIFFFLSQIVIAALLVCMCVLCAVYHVYVGFFCFFFTVPSLHRRAS